MPVDLVKEREPFGYEVEYGWPGMPTETKLVDVNREVGVGTQILVDGLWWVVERVDPPRARRGAPRARQGDGFDALSSSGRGSWHSLRRETDWVDG